MKSDDVNSDTDVDFNQKNNELDPTFEDVDHVRISKYKKIFVKGYTPNINPWTYVISDLNVEELRKINQTEITV